jgi:hypothetical protein
LLNLSRNVAAVSASFSLTACEKDGNLVAGTCADTLARAPPSWDEPRHFGEAPWGGCVSSRRPPIRKADLTRALAAARAAGVVVDRIEIDLNSGKIIVLLKDEAARADEGQRNEWDE